MGFGYYRRRIAEFSARYEKVLLLGDSMGATGALMFSPLATSVHAFAPQVCPYIVCATAPDLFLPLSVFTMHKITNIQ